MKKTTRKSQTLSPKELAEHHAQPHIRKAMSMSYELAPFLKAGVIGPGRSTKGTRPTTRGSGR